MKEHIQTYWQEFTQQYPTAELYEAFQFGSGGDMADELGQLVVEGKKTATCSAYPLYAIDNEPLPQVGQYSIVLSSIDEVMAIIKTTEVSIVPMNEVSEEFAIAEGEGDYQDWWDGHVRFFSDLLPVYKLQFSEDLLLVCERFEVVKRYEKGSHA